MSTVGEFAYVKCYSPALRKDGRSPGSTTSCEEQTSGESPRKRKQSGLLQELLLMSAEDSCDSGEEMLFLWGTV